MPLRLVYMGDLRRSSNYNGMVRPAMRGLAKEQEKERDMYQRVLRRQNGIIGGVCGGLGAYFGVSPWWFRLLFLFLLMPGGLPGFLPYVVLWIAMPKADRYQ
jgi:phage shock protein C